VLEGREPGLGRSLAEKASYILLDLLEVLCGNSANNKEVTGGSKVVRWTIRFSFPRFHSIGFFLFHFSTYSALELVLGSDAFRVAFFSLFLYPAFTSS